MSHRSSCSSRINNWDVNCFATFFMCQIALLAMQYKLHLHDVCRPLKHISQCRNISKNPIDLHVKFPWNSQNINIVSLGALRMSQTFRHRISCSSGLPDRIVCPYHNAKQVFFSSALVHKHSIFKIYFCVEIVANNCLNLRFQVLFSLEIIFLLGKKVVHENRWPLLETWNSIKLEKVVPWIFSHWFVAEYLNKIL